MGDLDVISSGFRQLQEGIQILLQERLPQDCPWHIEVLGDGENYSEATVVLKQGEKTFNFGDLCPGTLFVGCKYESAAHSEILKTIKFKLGDIESKYFLPILLHEIGHSHSKNKQQKLRRLRESIIDVIQGISPKEGIEFQEVGSNLGRPPREETYLEERDAWSYALKAIKELEKKGFHISQGCTLKEIRLFMEMSLFTYELARDKSGEHSPIIKRVKGKIFRTIYGDQ